MVNIGLMELYSTSEPGCFRLGGHIGTSVHSHISTLNSQHVG